MPRATAMAEFHELQARMLSHEGVMRGLGFRPRPSDVVVTPFGKCGTIWLQ